MVHEVLESPELEHRKPEQGSFSKRSKNHIDYFDVEMKKISEIVLVLASLSQIRGTRVPSSSERALMGQARAKLVSLCELMAPGNLVDERGVTVLVRNLGLDGSRDRRCRVSIAEKMLSTKRKMEEQKEPMLVQEGVLPQVPKNRFPISMPSHGQQEASSRRILDTNSILDTSSRKVLLVGHTDVNTSNVRQLLDVGVTNSSIQVSKGENHKRNFFGSHGKQCPASDSSSRCSEPNAIRRSDVMSLPIQLISSTLDTSLPPTEAGLQSSGLKHSGTSSRILKEGHSSLFSQGADRSDMTMSSGFPSDFANGIKGQKLVDSIEKSVTGDSPTSCILHKDQESSQVASSGTSNSCKNKTTGGSWFLDLDLHQVDWVGDKLYVVDGKAHYRSCLVNDVVYKLQDYALFRPDYPNFPPYIAKLQTLWEDATSGLKYAHVNWCYYPEDLAQLVYQPGTPEKNEVYESNYGAVKLLGSIIRPCNVLSKVNYQEEIQRRSTINDHGKSDHPFFICKWFYDEPKGTFHPFS